ncbi:hypothetical protein MN0502_27970 [Arthrobacter sp. MN05-02]|nr:hypothetical protein MN0502_27970 [Arthrobacter sp. MN05-02]
MGKCFGDGGNEQGCDPGGSTCACHLIQDELRPAGEDHGLPSFHPRPRLLSHAASLAAPGGRRRRVPPYVDKHQD